MKKIFTILAISLILLQCCAYAYIQRIKPGRYNCPYYYNGKENNCAIDVDWKGQAMTECSFLNLSDIKRELNSNRCTFIPPEYYSCQYSEKGHCEVGLGRRPEQYIVNCKVNVYEHKALDDARNGRCPSLPAVIAEDHLMRKQENK